LFVVGWWLFVREQGTGNREQWRGGAGARGRGGAEEIIFSSAPLLLCSSSPLLLISSTPLLSPPFPVP